MPKEVDKFLDALDYYYADEAVISDPTVQGLINNARHFGYDALETFQSWFKKDKTTEETVLNGKLPLTRPAGLVRTISETAFLEPKTLTAADEVTKPELKEHTTFSKIFRNISYGVRDLSITAAYKDRDHNRKYTLRAGDKFGLQYQQNNNGVSYSAGIEHNIFSNRTRISGSVSNPLSSYNISVYKKDSDIGATVGYSNHKGFNISGSVNNYGAAISAGYSHHYSDCDVSFKGFISTQQTNMGTYSTKDYTATIGVCGTITM